MNVAPLHPSQACLVAYVEGSLGPSAAERVEAHIERCHRCAARVQAEAKLEMVMLEVAELHASRSAVRAWPRRVLGSVRRVGAVASMAAGVLFMVSQDPEASSPPQSLRGPLTDGVSSQRAAFATRVCSIPQPETEAVCHDHELVAATFPEELGLSGLASGSDPEVATCREPELVCDPLAG